MFNKDLEELENKKAVMSNTISKIKNTLEGINSRITKAEKQRSKLDDRMVEITSMEQNKEIIMKKMRTVSETSGTTLSVTIFEL